MANYYTYEYGPQNTQGQLYPPSLEPFPPTQPWNLPSAPQMNGQAFSYDGQGQLYSPSLQPFPPTQPWNLPSAPPMNVQGLGTYGYGVPPAIQQKGNLPWQGEVPPEGHTYSHNYGVQAAGVPVNKYGSNPEDELVETGKKKDKKKKKKSKVGKHFAEGVGEVVGFAAGWTLMAALLDD